MYIPTLREMLDEFRIPLGISFSVTVSDDEIDKILYDSTLHNVLIDKTISNLRKKIRSRHYSMFYVRYPECIDYDIDGSIIIEWLDVDKINTIDYDVNMVYYRYSRELDNSLNRIGS